MNRLFSAALALAAVTLAADLGWAQRPAQTTLADRFGALREGWSFSSDQPAAQDPTPPPPTPAAAAPRAVASDSPAPFPRVNPRELLPREWFGVGVEEVRARKQAAANAATGAAATADDDDLGTARARLLRDLRRPTNGSPIDEPRLARRAPVRAGSAISADAPQPASIPTLPSVSGPAASKAIAAEVAQAMELPPAPETPDTTEPADQPAAIAALPESTGPLAEGPAQSLAGDEPPAATTPQETPSASEPAAESVAESDTTRVRVAANPTAPTKLPLFIGDDYSETDQTVTVAPAAPASAAAAEAFSHTPSTAVAGSVAASSKADEGDFLLTQSLPVLVSRVGGPRTIVVGHEATYRVLLANRGDVTAEGVVTTVRIPEWADVVGAVAEQGAVEPVSADGEVVWRTDRLAAGEVLKLDLRLVATAGKPIELAVKHSHRPIDSAATVEVQEPKLSLAMAGPSEVHFGRPQTFRLTISNPGTGAAERVRLTLTPPGGDSQRRTTHDLGSIAAGAERSVEIELTAREAGELAINASAHAEGDLTAEISKPVFCRKAELVVDWRGPSERYAGATAVYFFRVRNPGTAAAPDVVLDVDLPEGFEPAAGSPAVEAGKLAYRVGSLKPGEDRFFELRGALRTPGANTITLRAEATDDTRSESVEAVTEVVAIADLKLDVVDPRGPVATGQEAEYKIRVTNRGASEARDVKIVALFSEGIEPHHTAGAPSTINDGRVAFETIDSMAIGQTKELIIHARAHEPGAHLFRAEVVCRDLEIKLAAEETTRFFEDESIDIAGEGYPSGETSARYPR
ncbi:CARDB domain-containing protein [Botrimarina sp.]|uniref:CARDB domain-containing protein n=1 Tax=Botrimarina sp. TaxID=2795802 RepID=UPI0032F09555